MKLYFEIAVDQQTRACDRTIKGVLDSGYPPVPAGQPRPYLVNCWPKFAKSPQRVQNHAVGCFTCTYLSPEHMYISFFLLSKLDKYDRFWPIILANMNIFE